LQWHCDEQNDLFQSREADRPEPSPVYLQVMIELRAGDLQLLSRHWGRAMNAATQHSMAPPESLRDSIAAPVWRQFCGTYCATPQ
jgi:hypothetical protein